MELWEVCLFNQMKNKSFAAIRSRGCVDEARCVMMVLCLQHFTIFGYARTKMTDEELRNMISKTLTCRIDKRWTSSYLFFLCGLKCPSCFWGFWCVTRCLTLLEAVSLVFGRLDQANKFYLICLSERTVVKRWTNSSNDASIILVNMILKKTLHS